MNQANLINQADLINYLDYDFQHSPQIEKRRKIDTGLQSSVTLLRR